jgi:hypothetical protein
MVTIRRQPTLGTLMPTLVEVFRRVRPASTSLRCAVRSYFNEPSTSVLSFVAGEVKELRPSGVINGLRQPTGGEPFDVQILNGDCAVVGDEPMGNLVVEVGSLVADVGVRLSQEEYGLTPSVGALRATGHLARCPAELGLGLPIPTRIFNLRPVRERGERREADINADAFSAGRKRLGFTLNGKERVPLPTLSFDVKFFNLPLKRPVQLDFDVADFRDADVPLRQGVADLPKRDGVVPTEGAKARVARLVAPLHTTEESFERAVNSFQDVKQYDRINLRKIGAQILDFGELVRLVEVRDGDTVQLPCVAPLLEGRVVKLTAKGQGLLKRGYLPGARIEPVFEGLEHS